ncbi:MAG TPA: hypothetical protein VNW27_00035 [Candidatus Bathyarchaeia archaeon]|jgi:hypothetical protein|nr:hypothetical protein [Candidatus Bathyarchaeia archaeon]
MAEITEIRILPPFAIARLGSSADPMDNYCLEIVDPIGPRHITHAETLLVDRQTAEARAKARPFEVKFRDADGNVRPVAPFLEVWALLAGSDELVPLTLDVLRQSGLTPADVKWSVQTANIKAFRRTGDSNDRILAQTGLFNDHGVKPLCGECFNFLDKQSISLGSVQYIKPNAAFPEIRLRFTPAAGKVYGPPPPDGKPPDGNLAGEVYDARKGHWRGWKDPADPKTEPILDIRRVTNPGNVYAGTDLSDGSHRLSWGYLDDECDGIVDVEITVGGKRLNAYARIAAGPPTFAPDSLPLRTVYDELEQAMYGPELESEVTREEVEQVKQIVRRALETVRLMNTAQMNKYSSQRGVGMARMDNLDVKRAPTAILDPTVADSLAIRSRHERVLLALESGSLAWFARVLREHDEVGDLTDDGRKKMPALMRGADARHLALTRRQVNKVRAAAEYVLRNTPAEGRK